MIILGLDGCEYNFVEEFDLRPLKQKHYGKINISKFEKIVTPPIWGTFFLGAYPDKTGIPYEWQEDPLDIHNAEEKTGYETIFQKVNGISIRQPGLSFGEGRNIGKQEQDIENPFPKPSAISIKDSYQKFLDADEKKREEIYRKKVEYELQLFIRDIGWLRDDSYSLKFLWTHVLDTAQHFYVGKREKMKDLYERIEERVKWIKKHIDEELLILSDHGGEPYSENTYLGSHSDHGFWSSSSFKMENPDMIDIHEEVIKRC